MGVVVFGLLCLTFCFFLPLLCLGYVGVRLEELALKMDEIFLIAGLNLFQILFSFFVGRSKKQEYTEFKKTVHLSQQQSLSLESSQKTELQAYGNEKKYRNRERNSTYFSLPSVLLRVRSILT